MRTLERLRLLVWAVCAALLLRGVAQAQTKPWWDERWTCRKTVQVSPAGDYGEDLAAAVAFTTAGYLQADADDLRILDEAGQEVPYYVVASGFEDLCTVVFPVERPQQVFDFYYGNPRAKGPDYDWSPKRGLILEVRTMGNGGINNWRQMVDLVRDSPEVQGRGLHHCVFDGHNRFGPSERYISIYKGYLYCPVSGEYDFATTSDDASFLFVDSDLVVQWPGQHGAVADARHHAKARLERGVHFLEYYHADLDDRQVAEAAWRVPGQEGFVVIPPEAFVPLWWGQVTQYERFEEGDLIKDPVDFSFWQESSVSAGDGLLSTLRFHIDSPSSTAREAREWDFGDGITSQDRSPTHVYVRPGTYRVSLRLGGQKLTQAVRVWHNERISGAAPEDLARDYARRIEGYDLSVMAVEELLALWEFARLYAAPELERQALAALIDQPGSFRDPDASQVLLDQADALWMGGHYDIAVELLHRLGARYSQKEPALRALYNEGQYLLALGKRGEAHDAFESLERRTSDRPAYRALALTGIGDCHRFKGDANAARGSYLEAEKQVEGPPGGRAVAHGAYAQAALEYLRAGELDAALEQVALWESAAPSAKLDGYFSLLKTIALCKRGDVVRAYGEARDQYAANPEGNYAPHMLLLQGDCLALWQHSDEAAEMYRKLVDGYPESPLRPVAQHRLQTPPKAIAELRFPVLDF